MGIPIGKVLSNVKRGERPSATKHNQLIDDLNQRRYDDLYPETRKYDSNQKDFHAIKGHNTSGTDFSTNDVVAIVGNYYEDETGDCHCPNVIVKVSSIASQDAEQDITVAICLDPIANNCVGRVLVLGAYLCRVYRPADETPGNLKIAGPKPVDGKNSLRVGEPGVVVLWEDTSGDVTQEHNALVLLGGGGSGGTATIARWAAYEDE